MDIHFLAIVVIFVTIGQQQFAKATEDGPSRFNFDCSGKIDGNYPHPTKCTHFVSCAGKMAFEVECAKNHDGNPLYYVRDSGPDPAKSRCDDPEVVDRDGSCNTRRGPIVLDWHNNPEHVIHINSGSVTTHQIRTIIPTKFKLSIQLAKMKAGTCDKSDDHPEIGLVAQPRFDYFCTNYDNAGGNFIWVNHTYNYDRSVEIEPAGTWGPQDEAILIATIYQDVNTCSDCPPNSFCCDGGSSCDGGSVLIPHPNANISRAVSPDSVRCIPNQLKCNKRPNCGKFCNADEKKEDCGEYGGALSAQIQVISIVLAFVAVVCFNL